MYDTLNEIEFKEWPKMPRFFDSKIYVSEKLDGTNGLIHIKGDNIRAGSRSQWVYPKSQQSEKYPNRMDNYGFAEWVEQNQDELIELLGDGYHYGEWWGQGIQRKYNMDKKVFSLFDVTRWGELWNADPGELVCDVVPFKIFELSEMSPHWHTELNNYIYPIGSEMDEIIDEATRYFMKKSRAAEKYGKEFTNPEGYVMFHDRSRQVFKVPISK